MTNKARLRVTGRTSLRSLKRYRWENVTDNGDDTCFIDFQRLNTKTRSSGLMDKAVDFYPLTENCSVEMTSTDCGFESHLDHLFGQNAGRFNEPMIAWNYDI